MIREVSFCQVGMSLVDTSPPSAAVAAVTKSHLSDICKTVLDAKTENHIRFAAHFCRATGLYKLAGNGSEV